MTHNHGFVRHDLLELTAAYAEYSVLVTTSELDAPGPQILYANSQFTRMTGYSVSELLGKTPRILQGPKTDRVLLKRLRSTLEEGKDFIGRTVNYRRDGTPFELEWVISHLRDSEGRTTHYIAIQRDITGQQRAADGLEKIDAELRDTSHRFAESINRLEKAEQRLADRERLAAFGEIAAGVVHDISNALTPVFGLIELMNYLDTMPPEAKEYASSLNASVEHAMHILANLKKYCRTELTAVLNEPVNLRALILQLPDLTKSRWWTSTRKHDNGISFSFDVQQTAIVAGNQTELLQVLVNLALNAIDAMPDGGTISVSLSKNQGQAILKISDTGVGMPQDLLQRCFDPYVTSRSTGTGLGLSVCRRIVQQHRGSIEVHSGMPTGVEFAIRLPLFDDAGPHQTTPDAIGQLRVLHICSAEQRRDDFQKLWQNYGVIVANAGTGDEGLQRLFESEFDFVVADSALRPTTGFDVVQAVKRTLPGFPIVISLPDHESSSLSSLPEHLQPDAILPIPCTSANLEDVLIQLGLWKRES